MKIRVQHKILAKKEEVTVLIFKDRKERAANSGWISAVAGYGPLPDFNSFEVLVVFAVQKQITTYFVMYSTT